VHWFLKSKSRDAGKLQRNNTSDYLLLLPYGINYSVSLDQADSKKANPRSVTSIGPGYYTEVGGLAVQNKSEGQDMIEFHSKDGGYQAVSYRSVADKTPLLRGGTNSGNAAAYEFLVAKNYTKNVTNISSTIKQHDAPDEWTFLAIERSFGKLLVGSKAKADNKTIDKEHYDLMVAKLSKKGPEVFSHKGIALLPGAVMIADYAGWQGEGHALAISIDENEDGVSDETLNLADEGGSYEDVIEADAETANEGGEGVDLAPDSETGNDGDAGNANSGLVAAGDGTNSGTDTNSGLGGDSDG
jgi:hypothetical protein